MPAAARASGREHTDDLGQPSERASSVGLESVARLGQNPHVGFNPFRQQRRRTTDYVFVAAAFLVVTLLLLWAALPA